MFRKLTFGVCILFMASAAFAANKEQERLENSGTVFQEVMDVPDNIPQELLEKAECIIVGVPNKCLRDAGLDQSHRYLPVWRGVP